MLNLISGKFKQYTNVIFYVFSSITKAFSQIAAIFLIAKIVTPLDLGIWSVLSLAVTYSAIINFGIISGLNRELPYNLGKNNLEAAEKMVKTAYFYVVFCCVFAAISTLGVAFLIPLSPHFFYGVLAIGCTCILTYYEHFLVATFRSNNAFKYLSVAQIVQSCLNVVSLWLIYKYGYYGLITKAVIVQLVFVAALHYRRPFKVKPEWNKEYYVKIIKVGFPIYLLAFLQSFSTSFDKLWLVRITDSNHVGFYSFAMYGFTAITLFQTAIAGYIYPKLTFAYGQDHDERKQWVYFKQITFGMLAILILICGFGYLVIPYVMQHFFPKYLPSLTAFKILLIASIFFGSNMGINIVLSMKKWKYIIQYQSLAIILPLVFVTLFPLLIQDKLTAVSLGVLTSNVLVFCGIWVIAYMATHEQRAVSNI